jgi:uncharacterized protein with von Willebrand factor type A (vWA) domain
MSGYLLHNLVLFGRLLRQLGLDVDPGRMIDLIQALQWVDIGRKEDFYHTARSLLVLRREDLPVFDEAFHAFWRAPAGEAAGLELTGPGERKRKLRLRVAPPPLPEPRVSPGEQDGVEPKPEDPPVLQVTRTYSDQERLRRKDFSTLDETELRAIERMIADLTLELGMRRSRRLQPGRGAQVDLRRTLRRNLMASGEILTLSYLRPKLKYRPLIILADISGSMERYTRLLLHFIYSLSAGLPQRVEAFVFSTQLTRITHELQRGDVDSAFRQIARLVPDWAGGTRIGEALKRFNYRWGRRVLGQGAVVLLISDGWDRGEAGMLQSEISRLQRSCYRLIWLNPLLGGEQYEPLTRGMRTALPYIDDFLPVHNLASLEDLAKHLREIDRFRPLRRQGPWKESLYGF